MQKRKRLLVYGGICAAILLLGLSLAVITLRSLGSIFGSLSSVLGEDTAKTMADIFSQTQKAQISVHILIPFAAVLALFGACYCTNSRRKMVLCILLSVFAFLIVYLSALLLSRVNDIRFIDLVISLANSISDGLFDSL